MMLGELASRDTDRNVPSSCLTVLVESQSEIVYESYHHHELFKSLQIEFRIPARYDH